ncbi:GCN5 family acetyltransferase [Brevibacillus panacihumi W25]|uniref:GCN5 family acetyltransferase n=1 Tax=Brevibacillus panacihumi W25 TaxID=1408254 RepID=V6MGV9_9BACL|nr:GNAT family N-acetyltransferase [Brevibacillus panacihumi]EST54638.1 GCN5 family acetyltransferase [Brevibacillus panacihumi W25]
MNNFRESITIREADEAEQEAVRSVMLEAYGQYADLFPAEVWKKYQHEIGSSVSGEGTIARLVAEIDGDIIGSVQLYPSSEAAYRGTDMGINSPVIRFLCVSRRARGKGVATALIEEVVKRSLAIGASYLYLHTIDMMASAIRLYKRMGFERAYEKEYHNGLHLVKCYRLSLSQAKRVDAAELMVLIRPEIGI